ncbi:hypothetical protein BGW80DRAFT_1462979 [Lactifluus volemus]|nr:hypothetical protein BGW80DRAFT_1462979 [Lactifluus volemus]
MLIPNLKPRFDIPKLPSHLTFEISPVPELIFLRTVKGLLSFLINLSLLDSSLILTIIFLINFNPPVRKKATTALTFLLLLFGLEISAVNVYALLCSWLSPPTTLEPLTVVIMGILNGVTPIATDSILLMHIAIDRIEHSKSRLRLAITMAFPVILKFGRLANSAIYILACAEFVLSSVRPGDGGVPDMIFLNAAQARSMEIAASLQIIDNTYQLALYHLNAFEQRRKALLGVAKSATSMTPNSLTALFFASAGNFLLPILLNAAQLAVSRRWPDSDIPRNIEQIKVILNVASAAITSIVAALKRWRSERLVAEAGEIETSRVGAATALRTHVDVATALRTRSGTLRRDVEANETTRLLLAGRKLSYSKSSQTRQRGSGVTLNTVAYRYQHEDQVHMGIPLPVL